LLYEGRINCFSPVTYLDRTDIYQIRPLIYAREGDIKGVVRRNDIPVLESSCPANGNTKRQDMKEIIARLDKETNPGFKRRLFTAIKTSSIDGWKLD